MTQLADLRRPTTASQKAANAALRYLLMLLLALAIFAVILLLSGKNPIQSYLDIIRSTLGSRYGISEVIVAMVPMVITALAVALPSRVGLINVGVEGQLYMGACLAAWAALTFTGLPAWALLPLIMLLGMLGGAAWAFIPGYLKSIGLVNETITSLLLNPVAPKIVAFFVFGFWHGPMDTNKTASFVPAARLPAFFGTRVDLSLCFALALLALFWYVMRYTRWGLEIRAVGGNPQAAQRNGIPLRAYTVGTMCLGGAIAGLAGMSLVSGYYGLLLVNFSSGIGYMGFLISWLSFGDPLGILLVAFLVSVITTGGNLLQLTQGLPYAVINILLALTLYIVLAKPTFVKKAQAAK
jgi:general nucleoside transport system permease protein